MAFNSQGSRGLRMSLPELNTIPSIPNIAFLKNTVPLSRQGSNQGSATGSIVEDNLSDLEGLSSQDSQGSQGSQEFRSVENSLNNLSTAGTQQHQAKFHQSEAHVAMPAQSPASKQQQATQVAEAAAISPRNQQVQRNYEGAVQQSSLTAEQIAQHMKMQPATYVAVQAPDGTIQHVQATPMFQMYPAHQQQYMQQLQLQQQSQQVSQVAPTTQSPQRKQQAAMQDTPIVVSDVVKPRSVSFAEQVVPIPATEKANKATAVAVPEQMYEEEEERVVMPRRAKRTYLALVTIGFMCWLVGLVGVAGTTATCPELPGGYESICREHIRITWFSYWLFVFLLMTLATVVIVGLFEQCRMVLMVMWGVCTSLLVFAVDYTLTLNDQMSLMEDRAQATDFRTALLQNDAQNFINCTYAGGILMGVCSLVFVVFTGGLDRHSVMKK